MNKTSCKKERIVNFRVLFFCFVAFFCAIIFCKNIFEGNWFYISFFCIVLIALLFLAFKRKCFAKILCVIFAFGFGLVAFCFSVYSFQGNKYSGTQTVQGQVKTVSKKSVVIENVTINNQKQKNIIVYTYGKNFAVGQIIKFEQEIQNANLFELGKFNSTAYKHYAPYVCNVSNDEITVVGQGRLSVAQKLQQHIKNVYIDNLPQEDVGLFYGMIFGDKSELDFDIRQSFQTSGISHMLAVSGLHIGFLVGMLNFVLGKLKTKRTIKCAIFFVILLFYCWMCSFSPSVVRASIMAMTVLLSGLFGKQYDFVNSISLSGIVILLFSPLSAFDIGFQLSFLSVFSIAFVYPLVTKFLSKTKLPKFLTDSFALTCCVQIDLLPLTANYFGQMSLLSIFANMICIPLFEIAFIGTFVTTIFASIFSPLGICFIPFKYIMNFITVIATFVSNQTLFMIKLDSFSFASVLCFYCGVFLVGNYVNLKKSIKFGACLFLVAFSIFYGTIMAIPKQYNTLSILQYQSTCHIIVSKNNKKLMLTNDDDIPYNFTNRCKINKINFLISNKAETAQIQKYYDIKQKSVYGTDVVLDDFDIKYIYLLDKLSFIQIKVDGYTIWYMTRTLSDVEEELLEDLPQPNIVINKNRTIQNIADYKLTSNSLTTPNKLVKNNNFGFEIKNGKLNKYWSLN